MFTEGLDESAINWIKQGKFTDQEPRVRSPLSENPSPREVFPKSPLSGAFASTHVLPPLKFHSGLLVPHTAITCRLHEDIDSESVDSVSDFGGGVREFSDYDDDGEFEREERGVFRLADSRSRDGVPDVQEVSANKFRSKLIRGFSKEENLRVELPDNRRFTDGDLGIRNLGQRDSRLDGGGGSCRDHVRAQRLNTHVFGKSILGGAEDLGTPSAPPIIGIGGQGNDLDVKGEQEHIVDPVCRSKESDDSSDGEECLADWKSEPVNPSQPGEDREKITMSEEKEEKISCWQSNDVNTSHYNTSGQYAWQTMVAYDACIRLCLHAWARGCTEAPEFLRDECLLLRCAFGLHKFLLQPRCVRPVGGTTAGSVDQVSFSKAKKVVGKIKVEVKKLRIIPRQKLRSTYSQRSARYIQLGAKYVQHVSSLVKTGMSSLKMASLPVSSEDPLPCLLKLKSATDDAPVEPGNAICLFAGSGDYHIFFPETEHDALLIEVKDKNEHVQGRATIPISSLADNQNDRIRWWPIYHDDQECVGKIQLYIGSTITSEEASQLKSGPVVETLAYDLLLEAAMRAQCFDSRNLRLQGTWKWLLAEFADYYGVSDSYTKLRYLLHVMNVATPTKCCFVLINELLMPILKARSEKNLTRQEKSILLECETQIESLLATCFENYKSLDEDAPTGLADIFGSPQETAAPTLAPAVQVYTLLHDILSPDAQTTLRNYFQTAARKRCRKHMVETDEFLYSNSEGFLMDSVTVSTAYLKMKNLCISIGKEIETDIKIHNEHVLPSAIDLSNIAAAVYSTEFCNRTRAFLAAWPPFKPQPHVNELLIAIADFERDLEKWTISPVQGGVDSRHLFDSYIMVWIEDMQLKMLDLCKAEKVPWSGVTTNYSTSPFAEEMYEKIRESLVDYEVVINRWPQYSLVLETAVANVERAIVKALEKQYNDILAPLKDSIPKRLNLHVQKLTRRQSMTLYSVPSHLGLFLNTIKRILDVLHCRVEEILRSWASYLPILGDKKSIFGEQMNGISVMLRTKYKNYLQATVEKLIYNTQANGSTRLKRILEEIREEDGEPEVRERMQALNMQLIDSISNLHSVFTGRIFVAASRGFWDRMGQMVLKFLEGRKENRVWYNGSYYALGILDDTFASQMQRLQGNALEEKDLEPPRSVTEARSILCRDTANAADSSTYFYV